MVYNGVFRRSTKTHPPRTSKTGVNMQYGTLNYNETSSPVRSVFESFECATCWRYFHDIFTIFHNSRYFHDIFTIFSRYFHDSRLLMQKTEMMQIRTFNYRENTVKISWKYHENILKISQVVKISWKYRENIVSRENIVKISWKYREKIVSRENVVITLHKSRLLTQMTEMMQADYREGSGEGGGVPPPRHWQFCLRDCSVMLFVK